MKCLIMLSFLMLVPVAAAAAGSPGDALTATLMTIARGEDPGFGRDVAPAVSVDDARPAAQRSDTVIRRMADEIGKVTQAFVAAPAAERIARTRAVVAGFDPETAAFGASRRFEGDGPYLSQMRQLLFVPTSAAGAAPAERLLAIISGFERTPRPADNYYEYSDPDDLKGSKITTLDPDDAPGDQGASRPMVPGRMYLLKKCRHVVLLGWYCDTSRYTVRTLPGGGEAPRALLTFLVPLAPGADNAAFSGGRAENVVEGYTAAYIVLPLPDLTLIYNLGIQSRRDEPVLEKRLNREHQKEYRELTEALKAALRLPSLPWKPANPEAAPSAPAGYPGVRTR